MECSSRKPLEEALGFEVERCTYVTKVRVIEISEDPDCSAKYHRIRQRLAKSKFYYGIHFVPKTIPHEHIRQADIGIRVSKVKLFT
jgi:hypothetical protein